MEAYPVTRNVNKKGFEGPECLVLVVLDQGELGTFEDIHDPFEMCKVQH